MDQRVVKNVKSPSHYTEGRKFEPKDVIRDWGLGFNLGSTVKYIARVGRKNDILQELYKAKEFLQFEIEALEEERAKDVKPTPFSKHPNCRCSERYKKDPVAEERWCGMFSDAVLRDELLSAKPIMVEVPECADIDEIIKHITKGLEKVVNTAEDHPKNKFEEFNRACLPVLEFLNKYYDPHSYAVITEGRAEIVRGDMGVPLPVRD